MVYQFQIPSQYPFDPPSVVFSTYDGITRFHPNMYVDGKVCLSILHTWNGPKWASTMRISTILVTLQSLLDSAPLRHEPGYSSGYDQLSSDYSKFIEVSCIRYILDRIESHIENKVQPTIFNHFLQQFLDRLPATMERLEVRLNKLVESGELQFSQLPYQMYGRTGYKSLLERLVKLKAQINSIPK
jgi:ubiquitin-conjugating enzyme E2 Z